MDFNSDRLVPGRAERSHNDRPKWDQLIDESKTADKVFEEPTLGNVKKWEKDKDGIDIRRIDTKKPRGERQDASPPTSSQASKNQKLKSLIGNTNKKQEIRDEAEKLGLVEEEIDDTLRDLSSKGEIFEPNKDEFKLI